MMKPYRIFALATISLAAVLVSACGRTAVPAMTPQTQSHTAASSSSETILHAFAGPEGAQPYTGALIEHGGNLFGTTEFGGTGDGVVYEVFRSAADALFTTSAIYTFRAGTDGAAPYAGLVADGAGNLYGTTSSGGTGCSGIGCGTVFELSPSGATWKETVLYRFTGAADGSRPISTLAIDGSGNLFGTANDGGHCSGQTAYGTVFELILAGGKAKLNVLHTFCGTSAGFRPAYAAPVIDKNGDLFATADGGTQGYGVVYELTPSAQGPWKETVLHDFTRAEGSPLITGLTMDSSGNLFGTGALGGTHDLGDVWELSPAAGSWKLSVLYNFQGGLDGSGPFSAPQLVNGKLYGTTYNGGTGGPCFHQCGTIYELSNTNGQWTENVLYRFQSQSRRDGYNPIAAPLINGAGNLFGTTTKGGGLKKTGTVYQFSLPAH